MKKISLLLTFLYISTTIFSSQSFLQISNRQRQRELDAQKDIDALFSNHSSVEKLHVPSILAYRMKKHPHVHQITVKGVLYMQYILKGEPCIWKPIHPKMQKMPQSMSDVVKRDIQKVLYQGPVTTFLKKEAGTRRSRE
ncbi:MAG TPA: hypothetical protein VLG50_00910 [Candidatus Saccharimonadales bacterium]|nr:hypothetical protein [Candidatus Saccharimonadales bacterium]